MPEAFCIPNLETFMSKKRNAALCLLLATFALPATAQVVDPCVQNATYDCGAMVRDELTHRATYYQAHVSEAFDLAAKWDKVFRTAYLRVKKQPRSTSDVDKILEEVRSEVNPVKWAEDKAIDAVVKKYLAHLAPLLDFLASAPAAAVSAFLTPSDTASDLDELESANKDVQKALFNATSSSFRPDWRMNYTAILQRISVPNGPEIRPKP
jgi:hypothetical protein